MKLECKYCYNTSRFAYLETKEYQSNEDGKILGEITRRGNYYCQECEQDIEL